MSAGQFFEYLWVDSQNTKQPKKVPAFEYIELLMNWIESLIKSEDVFPQKVGVSFPLHFHTIIKTVFKRMFWVYAHIYHAHFSDIKIMEMEAHVNTSFKHFVYFVEEFNLVDEKE